jgi:hypothetical protein
MTCTYCVGEKINKITAIFNRIQLLNHKSIFDKLKSVITKNKRSYDFISFTNYKMQIIEVMNEDCGKCKTTNSDGTINQTGEI